jgi:hypothetical protein
MHREKKMLKIQNIDEVDVVPKGTYRFFVAVIVILNTISLFCSCRCVCVMIFISIFVH